MADVKLLPCPFCGGEAEIIPHEFSSVPNSYGAGCCDCGAKGYQFFASAEEAAGAWNQRVQFKCKDCKYWRRDDERLSDTVKMCDLVFYMAHENGFCSKFERCENG